MRKIYEPRVSMSLYELALAGEGQSPSSGETKYFMDKWLGELKSLHTDFDRRFNVILGKQEKNAKPLPSVEKIRVRLADVGNFIEEVSTKIGIMSRGEFHSRRLDLMRGLPEMIEDKEKAAVDRNGRTTKMHEAPMSPSTCFHHSTDDSAELVNASFFSSCSMSSPKNPATSGVYLQSSSPKSP